MYNPSPSHESRAQVSEAFLGASSRVVVSSLVALLRFAPCYYLDRTNTRRLNCALFATVRSNHAATRFLGVQGVCPGRASFQRAEPDRADKGQAGQGRQRTPDLRVQTELRWLRAAKHAWPTGGGGSCVSEGCLVVCVAICEPQGIEVFPGAINALIFLLDA